MNQTIVAGNNSDLKCIADTLCALSDTIDGVAGMAVAEDDGTADGALSCAYHLLDDAAKGAFALGGEMMKGLKGAFDSTAIDRMFGQDVDRLDVRVEAGAMYMLKAQEAGWCPDSDSTLLNMMATIRSAVLGVRAAFDAAQERRA